VVLTSLCKAERASKNFARLADPPAWPIPADASAGTYAWPAPLAGASVGPSSCVERKIVFNFGAGAFLYRR
jgi:hypothetical protein